MFSLSRKTFSRTSWYCLLKVETKRTGVQKLPGNAPQNRNSCRCNFCVKLHTWISREFPSEASCNVPMQWYKYLRILAKRASTPNFLKYRSDSIMRITQCAKVFGPDPCLEVLSAIGSYASVNFITANTPWNDKPLLANRVFSLHKCTSTRRARLTSYNPKKLPLFTFQRFSFFRKMSSRKQKLQTATQKRLRNEGHLYPCSKKKQSEESSETDGRSYTSWENRTRRRVSARMVENSWELW